MKRIILAALAVFVIAALPAAGGKYAPSLSLSPDTVQAGDYFDVSGCGYAPHGDSEFGNVIIGFIGAAGGSPLDADGCFSNVTLPAMNGDSLAPGEYPVRAYQQIHPNKLTKVAEATLTVVP